MTDAPGDDEGHLDDEARRRRFWRRFGVVAVSLLLAGGLVLIAVMVLVGLALNDWSSNK